MSNVTPSTPALGTPLNDPVSGSAYCGYSAFWFWCLCTMMLPFAVASMFPYSAGLEATTSTAKAGVTAAVEVKVKAVAPRLHTNLRPRD